MSFLRKKFQQRRTPCARGLLSLSVGIGFIAFGAGLRAETNFVIPAGSFGPIRNDSSKSFSLVETATRALPPEGGTVRIAPGLYRHLQGSDLVLDHPATLEKDPAGGAGVPVIGDQSDVIATTTLNVLTWNCRLFDPDFPFTFGQKWMDEWRARHVGWYLRLLRSELDVVALCEVWDFSGDNAVFDLVGDPLRTDYDGGEEMLSVTGDLSAYPGFLYSRYNDNSILGPFNQNSGLAMFSNFPVLASFGYPDGLYSDCDGIDCRADKGWMGVRVNKDGFEIYVINTHTQAQDNDDAVEARNGQLAVIADYINSYRNDNPGIPVILMGDLNVIAETGNSGLHSTYDVLPQQFGSLGGKDAVRHTPKCERVLDERMKVGGSPNSTTISTSLVHTDFRAVYTWAPYDTQFGDFLEYGNGLSLRYDPTRNERLDYIIYFPSADGTVLIEPEKVEVIVVKKRADTDDDFTSDEVSDHYPLKARLRLTRIH